MKFVTLPDLETLPQRAIDLYAAREVLRALQWHRKANRGSPQAELFEQLAAELQAPTVNSATLRRLQSQFETLYEPLPGGFPRFAAVSAASVCEDEPTGRGTASGLATNLRTSGWWMPKDLIIEDYKLWQRTNVADFRALAAMSPAQLQVASARSIGPLWKERTPHWLQTSFPTRRELRRREDRIWGRDRPTWRVRGARARHPSPKLPASLRTLLDPGPFDLRYSVDQEYLQLPSHDTHSITPGIIGPATEPRAVHLTGRHRFRAPADPRLIAALQTACPSPNLRPLLDFYRAHDGALLFLPDGVERGWAHAELVGLRDQPRAKRILLYDLENLDDPERVPRMLSKARLTPKTIHILAFIRRATLVVDLGPRAPGRILTMDVNGVFRPFAPDFPAALARIIRDIARIGGHHGLVEGPDDQTGRSGILRLRSARKLRAADTE
jgi:hypothetical protein